MALLIGLEYQLVPPADILSGGLKKNFLPPLKFLWRNVRHSPHGMDAPGFLGAIRYRQYPHNLQAAARVQLQDYHKDATAAFSYTPLF
jgi:hypothetical protein